MASRADRKRKVHAGTERSRAVWSPGHRHQGLDRWPAVQHFPRDQQATASWQGAPTQRVLL